MNPQFSYEYSYEGLYTATLNPVIPRYFSPCLSCEPHMNLHIIHMKGYNFHMNESVWTPERLAETLKQLRAHGGDSYRVEVKKALDGYPASLDDTLCSFSNIPAGGTIICGVAEKDNFRPVGVYDIAQLEKTIESKMRKQLSPPNTCTMHRVHLEKHEILVIEVPGLPTSQRPARIGAHYYVRVGDGDHRMDEYEVNLMLSQREKRAYDAEAVPFSSVGDLDTELAASYIARARSESSRLNSTHSDQQVLERKRVLSLGGNELTLAGLYSLGDYPQQFFPSLKITGVVVDPGGISRNLDKFQADGPIPSMLAEALRWITRNLHHRVQEVGNGHVHDVPEVPAVALRELIANALVHRSLNPNTYTHEVKITILPQEIRIENPGGLWGITDEDLQKYGTHSRVNPLLYDMCTMVRVPGTDYRVIEGEGSGIPVAQEAVQSAGLRPIRFINGATRFTAVISREPDEQKPLKQDIHSQIHEEIAPVISKSTDELISREEAVFNAIAQAPQPLSVNEIMVRLPQAYMESKAHQIRYDLSKLLKEQRIQRQGGRGNHHTVYSLPIE